VRNRRQRRAAKKKKKARRGQKRNREGAITGIAKRDQKKKKDTGEGHNRAARMNRLGKEKRANHQPMKPPMRTHSQILEKPTTSRKGREGNVTLKRCDEDGLGADLARPWGQGQRKLVSNHRVAAEKNEEKKRDKGKRTMAVWDQRKGRAPSD